LQMWGFPPMKKILMLKNFKMLSNLKVVE
jgi:hypothetical protein